MLNSHLRRAVQCVRYINGNDDLLPEYLLKHGPFDLTRFVCAEMEGGACLGVSRIAVVSCPLRC